MRGCRRWQAKGWTTSHIYVCNHLPPPCSSGGGGCSSICTIFGPTNIDGIVHESHLAHTMHFCELKFGFIACSSRFQLGVVQIFLMSASLVSRVSEEQKNRRVFASVSSQSRHVFLLLRVCCLSKVGQTRENGRSSHTHALLAARSRLVRQPTIPPSMRQRAALLVGSATATVMMLPLQSCCTC